MKVLRLYINGNTNKLIGFNGCSIGNWLWLARGDVGELQIQVVNNDQPSIADDGTASAADVFSLSDITAAIFGLKTLDGYLSGGDWQQSFSAFNTSSTWHSLANGRMAIPYWILRTLDTSLQYVASIFAIASLNTGAALIDCPLNAKLVNDMFTGSEPSGPAGSLLVVKSATISGSAAAVVVPYVGMTAAGKVILSQAASTGGQTVAWATYQADQFTVNVAQAPGSDNGTNLEFNFDCLIVKKS